jgi:murein L,D-transpeptidase YcbB/YkuD
VPVEQLRASIASGRTLELIPPQDVQVALAYLTAWPRQDGRLALHPDPYGIERGAPSCRPATRT